MAKPAEKNSPPGKAWLPREERAHAYIKEYSRILVSEFSGDVVLSLAKIFVLQAKPWYKGDRGGILFEARDWFVKDVMGDFTRLAYLPEFVFQYKQGIVSCVVGTTHPLIDTAIAEGLYTVEQIAEKVGARVRYLDKGDRL